MPLTTSNFVWSYITLTITEYSGKRTEFWPPASRKSVGPTDMSGKIVSGPVTIPRNPDRMSGVVFAPKI